MTPDRRARLAETAIEFIRTNFTRELMCERTLDVYREVLALPAQEASLR